VSEQLRIDGTEVPVALTPVLYALSDSQRGILHTIGEHGFISSTQAGVIVHGARGWCGFGSKSSMGGGEQCCGYACADGLEAMKRLLKRNLVRRERPGRWVRP
jgi:hypothetical protein